MVKTIFPLRLILVLYAIGIALISIGQNCKCQEGAIPTPLSDVLSSIEDSCLHQMHKLKSIDIPEGNWIIGNTKFSVFAVQMHQDRIWFGNIESSEYQIHITHGEVQRIFRSAQNIDGQNLETNNTSDLIYCRRIQIDGSEWDTTNVRILTDTISHYCNCSGIVAHYPSRLYDNKYSTSHYENCSYKYSIDHSGNGNRLIRSRLDDINISITFARNQMKSIRYDRPGYSFCEYLFKSNGKIKKIISNGATVNINKRKDIPLRDIGIDKVLLRYPPIL
jgi:hypothetical protein